MEVYSDEAIQRTHHCGQLRSTDVGQSVRLCGWVNSYRDHGGVVFVDLRDREGITQVVFDLPEGSDEAAAQRYSLARALRNEWVISAAGKVRPRGEGRINPKLPTGEIEVLGTDLAVLNRSDTPPFFPDDYTNVSEESRLKYRYIDLRRPEMTKALRMRAAICRAMRGVLDEAGFVEVETPFLTKSTPEGARDFLVPSRLQLGSFYALPQSPQLFKQILMVGGLDKYYQIVRCFRDEDLRADRQPEFTQLDVEMSFCNEAQIMAVTEEVMRQVCKVAGKSFPKSIPVIPYAQAMELYGIDRPDLRFGLELHDVSKTFAGCGFKVFADALAAGGIVKVLRVPDGAKLTRKEIDQYTAFAAEFGAKGMAWFKMEAGKPAGGIAKFLSDEMLASLKSVCGLADGDIFLFQADKPAAVNKVLAALRSRLGKDLRLYRDDDFAWCWVSDFPLLDYSEEERRWVAMHHPFTSPQIQDLAKLESDPGNVRARAYDIVCNGLELGGGSIRIHTPDLQTRVFKMLGINEQEAQAKFSFLLDALRFGAPPHGGIALGIDRIAMIMAGGQSLRDVIAFPKTQRGSCPLTNAPSEVDDRQLAELDLRIIAPLPPRQD